MPTSQRCRPSAPTASTSTTSSRAPGRRWSCSTARPRRRPRTGRAQRRCLPTRLPALPGRRARPRRHDVGRRDGWSAETCSSRTWRRSSTRSGSRPSTCVGFSMGAMTALTFATRHPERLRTAIISGIDVQREPRTSVARRAHGPGAHRARGAGLGGALERRHGPVQGAGAWRRLLPAIAATSPRSRS